MLPYHQHMALTVVTLHGQILQPVTNVPAVGTVQFNTLVELRDTVDNIVYAPMTFTATLDAMGEFTIILPATDNLDLVPTNWVYQVWINTDILNDTQYFQLPFAPGVTEFADLEPLDYDPCAQQFLGTPTPPDNPNLFVLKSGDTMTGNLIINANLQVSSDAAVGDDLTVGGDVGVTGLGTFGVSVNTPLVTTTTVNTSDLNATDDVTVGDDLQVTGDANVDGALTAQFQGVEGNVVQMLATAMSTCVYNGGEIVPNVDPTKVDIAPATCWIFDYNSTTGPVGPTNPVLTVVNFAGVTGLTPAFAPFTYYSVNSAGALVQQATRPTAQERRQRPTLGLTLTQGGVIVVDQSLPIIPSQLNNQLADLMEGVGPFSTQGNVLSSNGVNLTFKKSAGTLFSRAFNQIPNYEDPHNSALAAQTPVNFRHITALVGSAGPLTTLLNVGFYDPNGTGVLTPVGGGANTSTNFRVWGFANNTVNEQILVQYGQNTYASLAAATAGLGSGNYIPQPATASGALLGWISVTRTATNLSDPTQAVFTKAAKFDVP